MTTLLVLLNTNITKEGEWNTTSFANLVNNRRKLYQGQIIQTDNSKWAIKLNFIAAPS